jgi:hypothetical protein
LSSWGILIVAHQDFFQDTVLAYVEKTWEQWLAPLVPDLPSYETVIGELRPKIEALLASGR